MRITCTPVMWSPAMMARWMGAAPRHLGSREAWRLKQPNFGASSTSRTRICPKATTTAASRFRARKASISARAFMEAGVRTGMPLLSAKAWTGVGRSACPRPRGFGGWE